MLKFKHFFVLCIALTFSLAANTQTSANDPQNDKIVLAKAHVYQGSNRLANVLLLKDTEPWGISPDPNETALANLGISYTVANSSQITTLDLSSFTTIIIASAQDNIFYANYNASLSKFTDFVNAGGNMEIHAPAYASITTLPLLPGGSNLANGNNEEYNIVTLPSHPMVAGISNLFYGNYANIRYFENLPAGTKVITRTQDSQHPTTIEYTIGTGVLVATTCPLEWAVRYNQGAASMLKNRIQYAINTIPPSPASTPVPNWSVILGVALLVGGTLLRFFR